MSKINYEVLVAEIIKPLVTHPEDVNVHTDSVEENKHHLQVIVHQDDLGRVIGKRGRVVSAVRTLVHAAASREKEFVEIEILGTNEAE